MLFNSTAFILFFPLVTVLFFIIPHKFRWALLLMASCIFYAWFVPVYLVILFALIAVDYAMGILIENLRSKGMNARKYLMVSILAMCTFLFVFKYFNFFSTNLSVLAGFIGLHYPPKLLGLILPIGLSFHTFQSLSYVIEVYKGRQKAERHFGIYALYVMFYPQLVAGPIERPYNLLPQFHEKQSLDYQRVASGLKLMVWGMCKKVVIADRLAFFVNQVFGNVPACQGPELMLGILFFSFQIYCDFSGYSDIAVGSARVMGFRLTNNFNYPFFSRSVTEFWRCWHISLFSWLKDYIFIPLCRSRYLKGQWRVNIFLTFVISGLWHGAAWTYVAWGAFTGGCYILDVWSRDHRKKIHAFIGLGENNRFLELCQVLATFSVFNFSVIFFRAKDLGDSVFIIKHLLKGWPGCIYNIFDVLAARLGVGLPELFVSMALIGGLVLSDLLKKRWNEKCIFANGPIWIQWSYYYLIVLAGVYVAGTIILGQQKQSPFIYFQF